jgi:hypothetical protein
MGIATAYTRGDVSSCGRIYLYVKIVDVKEKGELP